MRLMRYLLWLVVKAGLSLRYRIRIHGAEQLRELNGPALVLPNHPSYTDPAIVITALWPCLRPRPVLYDDYFKNPLLKPFASLLRGVRVPNLQRASLQARQRAEEAIAELIAALRQGDSVIIWPAGHVTHDGVERLGGARTTADILRAVPEVQVVLIRTRGLLGSMFSYAPTGARPRLIQRVWQAIGIALANLVFFMPRRQVDIHVERIPRESVPEPRRETVNPWLEAWFNAGGPDAPTFVPYHFWFGPRTHQFPALSRLAAADFSTIKPETKAAIAHILADRLKRPLTAEEEQPTTTFDQLGLDSLDRMEVTLAVEQRFGFHGDQVPVTIGQLWMLAEGLVERAPPKPPPALWFRPPSEEGLCTVMGETIAEAFVARALAHRKDVAAADDLSGVLTYERLLVGALVMARRFAALPANTPSPPTPTLPREGGGGNVGLLLPASVACDVAFLGLHLAGKLPVLLNWTTGPANLAHAARLMGLTHAVTSRAFIDRTGVMVEGVEYLYLEDVRKQTSRLELLRTLLTVRLFSQRIRSAVPSIDPARHAVVLFTSGSERAPKAVPLTHGNIIAELRSGIPFLDYTHRESFLGFLPAFHSFGLVVTSLLPLLGGMRVVHHPDPTDAAGLARKLAAYRPTLLIGTPTFVNHIAERAEPGGLSSLTRIIVGAEKCPAALIGTCARVAPQAAVLEGYGITECSPVVSCNRVGANRPGTVGHPMTGINVCVVDLETEEELPRGGLGMLWVNGPTVFPGYIGDAPSPFRERDGKRWYVTGDLAEIDADGYIRLAGRLKRFLKAGGEMISLPALEEPFARRYPPTDDGPRVAVEGIETEHGRRIVLFTKEPITLVDANALLLQEGFRGVLRFDEVRRVDTIPVLGTGKVDYKVLRAQIEGDARIA